MNRGRGRRLALLCCAAAAAVGATSAAAAGIRLGPPPAPGGSPTCDAAHIRRSLCGPVTVPLDRAGRVPGTLRLWVHGETETSGTGTVLVLDGSPHGRATQRLFDYSLGLERLAPRRVVAFDMRGTGASRLECDALQIEPRLSRAVADCAAQLDARRALFTVADDVADAEAVRTALGIERMTIYGFDYGARVAVAYATAHPDRVERLVLDSPEPLDGPDPLGRSVSAAIRRVAGAVCRHGCRFTRHTGAELAALLERLAHGPLRARAFDGRGHPRAVSIGPQQVRDALLAGDDSIVVRLLWPSALHAALAGDTAPLARLVRLTAHAGPLRAVGGALRLARMCGGRIAGTPTSGLPADFAPFTAQLVADASPAGICASWPDPPAAQPALTPPAIPTLVRAGEMSLTTPLEDAQALAARIPGAQLLPLPPLGHDILNWSVGPRPDCSERALQAFRRGERISQCRAARGAGTWPIAAPRSLAELDGGRRLPRRVGRTLRAVRLTLLDAVFALFDFELSNSADLPSPQLRQRWGGLRGGFERITRRAWTLHRYEYVPGVTLSGRIASFGDDDDSSLTLRIGGSAAARGQLREHGRCGEETCLVGRLGGRIVHVQVPGSA